MSTNHNPHLYAQTAEKFLKSTYGVFAIALLLIALMPRESKDYFSSLYVASHTSLFVLCLVRFVVLAYYKKNRDLFDWTLADKKTRRFYYALVGLAWVGALAIGLMTIGTYLDYGQFSPNSVVMTLAGAAFAMFGSLNIAFNFRTIAGYNFFVILPAIGYMAQNGAAIHTGYWLALILFFVMCTGQAMSNRSLMLEYLRTSDLNFLQVQYYKLILDSVPGLISVFDKDLKYQLVNSHVVSFVGLPDSEIVGSNLGFRNQDSEFRQAILNFQSGSIESESRRIVLKSNGQPIWHMMALQRIRKTEQIVVVSININDQVLAEESALEQRLIIQSSAQLAAIGELAAGIAHEINNPLAIITSKAEQTLRRVQNTVTELNVRNDLVVNIEKIKETAFRIARIVKGLRALARDGENDDFTETNFSEMLKDVLVLLEEKMKSSDVELRTNFSADLVLDCRVTQFSQVLLNLISNSIDAIKDRPEKWIEVEARNDESSTIVAITDCGDGIPESIVNKLMTPFFTTKAAGVGTGLGLSIAKRILTDHGGDLYYDRQSKNTRFEIRLPKASKQRRVS